MLFSNIETTVIVEKGGTPFATILTTLELVSYVYTTFSKQATTTHQ